MPSINDWAAKAAERIVVEVHGDIGRRRTNERERIAAIIETFARPLLDLLNESRHLQPHAPGCMAGWAQIGVVYEDTKCTCDVAAWNAKVDAALVGHK